ncbi:hypothetical protein BDZ85DRAFT_41992 [Elsinoe ampelina]|uniref:Uncharacterized protein n=1 Tax=Elsinoe ampelina TaxID=302913 RepID=A0A6A6G1D8_9PEZI|nr:hypothetical protein BDZ85DRAFT_41992 [Elsinoe ampelina]
MEDSQGQQAYYARLVTEIEGTKTQLATLTRDKEALERAVENHKNETAEMRERIDRLEEGLRNAESQNNTLCGRVTKLENELNKQKDQVAALVKWKNGPLENNSDLQTRHNAASSTLRRRISSSSSESFDRENWDVENARREAILEKNTRITQSIRLRKGMVSFDSEDEEEGKGEVAGDSMDM